MPVWMGHPRRMSLNTARCLGGLDSDSYFERLHPGGSRLCVFLQPVTLWSEGRQEIRAKRLCEVGRWMSMELSWWDILCGLVLLSKLPCSVVLEEEKISDFTLPFGAMQCLLVLYFGLIFGIQTPHRLGIVLSSSSQNGVWVQGPSATFWRWASGWGSEESILHLPWLVPCSGHHPGSVQ